MLWILNDMDIFWAVFSVRKINVYPFLEGLSSGKFWQLPRRVLVFVFWKYLNSLSVTLPNISKTFLHKQVFLVVIVLRVVFDKTIDNDASLKFVPALFLLVALARGRLRMTGEGKCVSKRVYWFTKNNIGVCAENLFCFSFKPVIRRNSKQFALSNRRKKRFFVRSKV